MCGGTERIQGYLAGPGFRWFATRPRAAKPPRWESTAGAEAVPAAVLPDDAPAPLIAGARILRLKEPVMDKQWRHHHDGRSGKWSPRHYEIPIEWYADIQALVDRITPRVQRRRTRTGRVVTRWVYEDSRSGQRLVVGVDKDDGVPIVLSLHRAAVE